MKQGGFSLTRSGTIDRSISSEPVMSDVLADTDFPKKGLERARTAQEFFNRDIHIARITRFINLVAQAVAGRLIKITIGSVLEDGGHVCGNGVGPGIPIIAGVIVHQMAKISDKRSLG